MFYELVVMLTKKTNGFNYANVNAMIPYIAINNVTDMVVNCSKYHKDLAKPHTGAFISYLTSRHLVSKDKGNANAWSTSKRIK